MASSSAALISDQKRAICSAVGVAYNTRRPARKCITARTALPVVFPERRPARMIFRFASDLMKAPCLGCATEDRRRTAISFVMVKMFSWICPDAPETSNWLALPRFSLGFHGGSLLTPKNEDGP